MDLLSRGRRDLAGAYADAYFDVADDPTGRQLLAFYVAYRAAVRGKVKGMLAAEPEIPAAERQEAVQRARGHWLLALSELEDPDRRPGLVLIGGLPGSGKSTLAGQLATEAGFVVVSSDEVRKALAGLSPDESARAAFGKGIYTPEWNARTYAACFARAHDLLFQGKRVIVDASFREVGRRTEAFELAVRLGVRALFLRCAASSQTVQRRLGERSGGASDADWSIHRAAAQAWEADDVSDPRLVLREVFTGGSPPEALATALRHLRELGLRRHDRRLSVVGR